MKKVFLSIIMTAVLVIPGVVFADGEEAQIGTDKYATLEEAVSMANTGDEITLLSDVEISGSTLKIDKNLTIDLNNHSISRTDSVLLVQGATLDLIGKGEVKETLPDYGAITVKGSDVSSQTNFTVVNVGKDVKLTGWAGINIQPINKTDKPYAYGVVVNIDGSIVSLKDQSNVTGSGVYVNGFIKHTENAPIINLNSNAVIESEGAGIYLAGYANLNVKGASVIGEENAIGAKAGIINIEEGSLLKAIGPDLTPTISYGNGINASGAAIQIESNSAYAGKVELNIKGGKIVSENGYAIYEYLDAEDANTAIEKINIIDGEFISADGKAIFEVSNSFIETHEKFITGGTFSADPGQFVDPDYISKNENGSFIVGKPLEENNPPSSENNAPTNTKIEANKELLDDVPDTGNMSIFEFIKYILFG